MRELCHSRNVVVLSVVGSWSGQQQPDVTLTTVSFIYLPLSLAQKQSTLHKHKTQPLL